VRDTHDDIQVEFKMSLNKLMLDLDDEVARGGDNSYLSPIRDNQTSNELELIYKLIYYDQVNLISNKK